MSFCRRLYSFERLLHRCGHRSKHVLRPDKAGEIHAPLNVAHDVLRNPPEKALHVGRFSLGYLSLFDELIHEQADHSTTQRPGTSAQRTMYGQVRSHSLAVEPLGVAPL